MQEIWFLFVYLCSNTGSVHTYGVYPRAWGFDGTPNL